LFTGVTHNACIEDPTRASKGDLSLPAIPMDRHHDMAFAPLLMLVPVVSAPLHWRKVALSMLYSPTMTCPSLLNCPLQTATLVAAAIAGCGSVNAGNSSRVTRINA